jgi:hypothetical protein
VEENEKERIREEEENERIREEEENEKIREEEEEKGEKKGEEEEGRRRRREKREEEEERREGTNQEISYRAKWLYAPLIMESISNGIKIDKKQYGLSPHTLKEMTLYVLKQFSI